jgi:hypothetical protein
VKYTIERVVNGDTTAIQPVMQTEDADHALKILKKLQKKAHASSVTGSKHTAFRVVPTPVFCMQCMSLLGNNPTCEQCRAEQARLHHLAELDAIVEKDRRMYGS